MSRNSAPTCFHSRREAALKLPFANRREAGQALAGLLADLRDRDDVVVLGLPRGGVPVAWEIALAIDAPLDVVVVRKLGVPGHEELAMGAIAAGDVHVLNEDVIHDGKIRQAAIQAVIARERRELLRQQQRYRDSDAPPMVRDRAVVLADDGLATGATMQAAIAAVRQHGPRMVIVAVPVGALPVCHAFHNVADRVICAATPEPFVALGRWYDDFRPVADSDVEALLIDAASRPGMSRAAPSSTPGTTHG